MIASTGLTLAVSGGQALSMVFGTLLFVALVALCFPNVRRNNALFAPCIIALTLALTVVGVGALLMAINHYQIEV